MMGGFGNDLNQNDNIISNDNSRVENETNFTSVDQPGRQYEYQGELEEQQIDFDVLLGDAVMQEAEYEEDREDEFEDDEDEASPDKYANNFAEDSLAFSMSMPGGIPI